MLQRNPWMIFCDWCLGQKMVKDAESLCSIGTKVHMPWLCSQCGVKNFTCATLCFGKRLCFFPLTPKFHFLLHVAADLKEQLSRMQSTDRYILNPGLFATQMAEDATGRSCRMARTCHVLTASVRVAQKWLIAIKLFWDEQAEQDDA
jgi:hypothetical protein